MTAITPNLGLTAYELPTDDEELVYDYINYVSGSAAGKNLKIIDDYAGLTDASLSYISASISSLENSIVPATVEQVNSGSFVALVSASSLAYSNYAKKNCIIPLNTTASLTTSDINYTVIPNEMNNWILDSARASCIQASTSGNIVIDVARNETDPATWTSMLSTPITILSTQLIDSGHAVVSTTASSLKGYDQIRVSCTRAGTSASFVQAILTFRKMI